MARDVVDRVAARLHALDGRPRAPRPPTDRMPLPGGEARDLEILVKTAAARVPEATARHLGRRYGSEAAAVLNLVDRDRALGQPIVAGRPDIWAEVTQAVERGIAVRPFGRAGRRVGREETPPESRHRYLSDARFWLEKKNRRAYP